MEKAFYSAIVLTAIVISIAVVLQGRNQAYQQQITDLNQKISDEKLWSTYVLSLSG